jgi:hypothetical protein
MRIGRGEIKSKCPAPGREPTATVAKEAPAGDGVGYI